MGTEIQTVKNQMTLKNWAEEVAECQSSGMTVSAWCELHGINVKTYYYHLRRVRESLLTENRVVPLSTKNISDNIEIFSGDMRITLPCGCPEEILSTVLKVLKNAQWSCLRLWRVSCYRIYGHEERNRRPCHHRAGKAVPGSVQPKPLSVLGRNRSKIKGLLCEGDGYMSVFNNNLMFIVFRRHWFYWVSRDFFDVYLMFILMKNGVISCNSVKGQSGWKRWYCVVCGILCNSIINFWPRWESDGLGL